jgi:hypothetical protein
MAQVDDPTCAAPEDTLKWISQEFFVARLFWGHEREPCAIPELIGSSDGKANPKQNGMDLMIRLSKKT